MKRLLEPDLAPPEGEEEEGLWATLCDDLVRSVVAAAPGQVLAPIYLVCRRWHEALERDSPQAPYWRAWFHRKPGYSLYEAGDPARPYATSWKALVRLQPMLQTTYFARIKLQAGKFKDTLHDFELGALPSKDNDDKCSSLDWRSYFDGCARYTCLFGWDWKWHPRERAISFYDDREDCNFFCAVPPEEATQYPDEVRLDHFLGFI
jgi:hypothetical protein